MFPKMVQKHDKKPNGIWNEFWMDFGAILAPFWEPWGGHGLRFWCQNRTFGKHPHQNGAQKLPGTTLLAPWRPKGMPKYPQGTQRPSFLKILVPRRDFFQKIKPMITYLWANATAADPRGKTFLADMANVSKTSIFQKRIPINLNPL